MKRIIHYLITAETAGQSLMEFFKLHGYSRHILISMKSYEDSILLNGSPVFLKQTLVEGDTLTVTLHESVSSEHILPVSLPFSVLYEDEDMLVINKPSDMPVHPSMGNHNNTLANAMAFWNQERNTPMVFRCINRLDRDTTGALILAKHTLSAAVLSQQMQKRQIHRTYLAVVEGFLEDAGVIDLPIGRQGGSALLRQVDPVHGERAVTRYRRLSTHGPYSLVQLNLETGRTHQIRVHMKHMGYPLPGDYLYNPNYQDFQRQPLHSWKLEFAHPITGESCSFTAPIPEDIRRWFPHFDMMC